MTPVELLSWNVIRVGPVADWEFAEVVLGELSVEGDALWFRPKKESEPAAWTFHSALEEISDVAPVERTLQRLPWSLDRGVRIRTRGGSQATFYLTGRAHNRKRAATVVEEISKRADSMAPRDGSSAPTPVNYVDNAEVAPVRSSMDPMRNFQRYSWLIVGGTLLFFIPELVFRYRDSSGIGRVWLLVYPGTFIAIGLHGVIGKLSNITRKNHPLLAVLPLCLYLVATAILALVIYAFYEIPIGTALAPLMFGIPAAVIAAMVLSPARRKAWREARDNDARRSTQPS